MGVKRVIIVDRDAETLCSLIGELKGEFAILAVRTTDAALCASPELYDAIFVSVAEDGRQALAFARHLQAKLITTPVIFSAANPNVAAVAQLAEAFAFLPQPLEGGVAAHVLGLAADAIGTRPAGALGP
jgi:DNA-binding NtrC family response regulator